MIQAKLLLLEYATVNDNTRDGMKLQAIREVKNLLSIIDFNLEDESVMNSDKLNEILTAINGAQLSIAQEKLVEELMEKTDGEFLTP